MQNKLLNYPLCIRGVRVKPCDKDAVLGKTNMFQMVQIWGPNIFIYPAVAYIFFISWIAKFILGKSGVIFSFSESFTTHFIENMIYFRRSLCIALAEEWWMEIELMGCLRGYFVSHSRFLNHVADVSVVIYHSYICVLLSCITNRPCYQWWACVMGFSVWTGAASEYKCPKIVHITCIHHNISRTRCPQQAQH